MMFRILSPRFIAIAALLASSQLYAHGDVTPQAVNTDALPAIENMDVWLESNPYSGNEKAAVIGKNAYTQNCARCHGIDAISGGIAPDLRELPLDQDGQEIYKERMTNGAIRNGITYMPSFWGLIDQKGLWAIHAWLETVNVEVAGNE